MNRDNALQLAVMCFIAAALVFCFSVSAHCQERKDSKFTITASVMAGLAAVDVAQTTTAIRSGRFAEGNPAMQGIASQPVALAAVKAGTVTAVWTLAKSLKDRGHRTAAWWVLGIGVGTQAFVVTSNAHQIGKR